jgi:polyhydroxybutyrate depolymerase
VLHFHGTADRLVLYDGGKSAAREVLNFKSVDETIRTWVKLDGCPDKAKVEDLPHKDGDPTTVKRFTYSPGTDGSEVILVQIIRGGHNWPGRPILPGIDNLLGPITHDISANEMIWDFFQKHPMK